MSPMILDLLKIWKNDLTHLYIGWKKRKKEKKERKNIGFAKESNIDILSGYRVGWTRPQSFSVLKKSYT